MGRDKTEKILDDLITLYNENSFLAACAKSRNLMSNSHIHRTIARDLLDVINELAWGELVDIKHELRTAVNCGVRYDAIDAEWA